MVRPIGTMKELRYMLDTELPGNNLTDEQLGLFASAIIDKGSYMLAYNRKDRVVWKLPVSTDEENIENRYKTGFIFRATETTVPEIVEDASFFAFQNFENLRDSFMETKDIKQAALLAKKIAAAEKVSDVLDMVNSLVKGMDSYELD